MTETAEPQPQRHLVNWGLWAIVAGAFAMVLVFVQMQLLSAQESAPIGQQIGEIAGDIRRAAWRSFLGLAPPPPEPVVISPSRRIHDMLYIITPVLGGLAIVLSGLSMIARENWRLALYGVALGGGAILFQYLFWMALLIMGFLLVVKIIENMGDIFGGFGGFGG